ncbi:hypothetical protein HHI36_011965 [Cryptolaemus montrouzieri]|uniref:Uncharacterized protein n=1 Tax=Cryptolaemus montrouzieri TaxID=559131 RepID=A0ABD2ND91_9CUCU
MPEVESVITVSENTERKKPSDSQDAIRKLKARLIPGLKYTLLCSLVFYLALLIIGILSVNKCPVDENIPLFLCITGFVGMSSKLVTYLRDRIIPYFKIKYIESALYTTETIFFFLGTYWVFKEFKPSFNPADGVKYCQETAYMAAFIYLTVSYVLLITILLAFLCVCCCCICVGEVCCVSSEIESVKMNVEVNESQAPYIDGESTENGEN